MKSVTVVISTYNGEKYIERQLDSIFSQEGVDVQVYVRDDGSKDGTVEVLRQYQKRTPFLKLTFSAEENVGWERSFLLALRDSPLADYYAFSDQDDIWFPNKLICCIEELEKHNNRKALMVHHDRKRVDENLNPLPDTSLKIDRPLNLKSAVVTNAQGCSMVFNKSAKELIIRRIPKTKIAHDIWTNVICYYFGEIYAIRVPLFYHIQYGSNASTSGDVSKGRRDRLKQFFKGGNIYENIASDLLEGYSDLITNKAFLIRLRDYKRNPYYKIRLLLDKDFVRPSLFGTVMLKTAILFNKI